MKIVINILHNINQIPRKQLLIAQVLRGFMYIYTTQFYIEDVNVMITENIQNSSYLFEN